MVFSSTVFLFLFLPLVIIAYHNPFFRGIRYRNGFLLLASIGFYAWGEPFFVFLMLVSIVVNWLLALRMAAAADRNIRKRYMSAAIAFDIALLFVFKYAAFTVRSAGRFFGSDFSFRIALPLGISFFTFQIMSYVFDVYYKKTAAQKSLVNLALYVSLFPQLIAGPIVRYKTVAAEIEARTVSAGDFADGMTRFVVGLAKKVLIANYTGLLVDRIFAALDGGALPVASAWLGAVAFNIQLYYDFSGYSDMAIGLGRIFGFHFPENFNYPYIAKSITEYWQRWHISLGAWFRDYVFTPLSIINRKKRGGMLWSLLVTWFLTGIWHGANWTFAAWGLMYFVLIAVEWRTNLPRRIASAKHFSWMGRVYMLFFVNIGHILFRSESLREAARFTGMMFGIGSPAFIDDSFYRYFSNGKWILLAGIVFSAPLVPWCKKRLAGIAGGAVILRAVSLAAAVILFGLSVLACIKSTYNPFIYFNF